jgi:hypothetical protein
MGTQTISNIQVSFARGQVNSANTPDSSSWSNNPSNPQDYRFAKVIGTANVPLTFMQAITRILGHDNSSTVPVVATATGGQAMITSYISGLLPFSPIAPSPLAPDNFGLVPGLSYTIRYPSGGGLHAGDVCPGDQSGTYWTNLPAQDRGYWGSTSSSVLRGEIVNDQQLVPIYIGDQVPMVGGGRTTEGDALNVRVLEDSNTSANTFAEYLSSGNGNGRRIVGLPINSGPTVVAPYDDTFIAVGVGAFFLKPAGVYSALTGHDPFCAEYIGPYVKGRYGAGAGQSSNSGSTGGYIVRLTN